MPVTFEEIAKTLQRLDGVYETYTEPEQNVVVVAAETDVSGDLEGLEDQLISSLPVDEGYSFDWEGLWVSIRLPKRPW